LLTCASTPEVSKFYSLAFGCGEASNLRRICALFHPIAGTDGI
jgi:hypothetical protein